MMSAFAMIIDKMKSPVISTQNLTKIFRPKGLHGVRLKAVNNVSLEIEAHQVFGLLGANGSGKTTFLKLILNLLSPTQGHCKIFGKPNTQVHLKKSIGYLPEAPYFYKYLSGKELLYFYGELSDVPKLTLKERVPLLLEQVNLSEVGNRLLSTYSKGMLQRIGIAQALIHDPSILILDEPISGLDPIGADWIKKIIFDLKQKGKTIILCSHLLNQVEDLCDSVGILNHGKLILQGSLEKLLMKCNDHTITLKNPSTEALADLQLIAKKYSAIIKSSKKSLEELFLETLAS